MTRTDDPFQAQDLAAGRLLWDPIVHTELYNEDCYYFLLRLRDPSPPDVVDQLQRLLVQAQIISSCIYVLFGYYDALIRVWATPEKRSQFVRILAQRSFWIEEAQEFQARSIDYLWTTSPADIQPTHLIAYKLRIDEVCRQILRGESREAFDAEIQELMQLGLVHELPATAPGTIKFYVALQRHAGAPVAHYESQHLRRAIKELSALVKNISVYEGLGFAAYLVKAVTVDFFSIQEWITSISRTLEELELRPLTLVIANSNAPQSDHVDVQWSQFGHVLLALESALGPQSIPLIEHFDSDARRDLADVFGEFAHLLGTPFEHALLSLLSARISQNRQTLNEGLSHLLLLETLLRQFFRTIWADELGTDWFKQLAGYASESGVNPPDKSPVADYTLHDIVAVGNHMVKNRVISEVTVHEVLGPNWAERIEEVREIRNEVAHGRLLEGDPSEYFATKWKPTAIAVGRIGDMYNRLVARLDTRGPPSVASALGVR